MHVANALLFYLFYHVVATSAFPLMTGEALLIHKSNHRQVLMGGVSSPRMVNEDGSYPQKPLKKDKTRVTVVQSDARRIVDLKETKAVMAENLQRMLTLGERACTEGPSPDFLLFHEFPLTGYVNGNRDWKLQVAYQIPGPETKALGELAKRHSTYVIFGGYAKDEDWPGHILSIATVINPEGEVIKKIWKPKNIKRFYDHFELTTTTVESVRDRFRELYGPDEELPVIQTEFGNIAVTTVQLDPMIFAAYAMKGTEIMLRLSTLFYRTDVVHTAMSNNMYSAMSNIPVDENSPYAVHGGESLIVSPMGEILDKVNSTTGEGFATAEIPIAKFREGRSLPHFPISLTEPVFSQYKEEIPPNHMDLPAAELPEDGMAMKKLLDDTSRWLNKD
jgi:predicted amidohydrolase